MSAHMQLNVFKVFLWRLCKKLNQAQYTNLKIKCNCWLHDSILALGIIEIYPKFA